MNVKKRLQLTLAALPLLTLPLVTTAVEPEEQYRQAREHYHAGEYRQALQILAETAEQHPENVHVQLLLGHAAFELDLVERALQAYTKALKLGRFEAATLARLAHLENRRGKTASALAALNMLMLVSPDDEDVILAAAELHAQAGDDAVAESLYLQVIEHNPRESAAYLRLADLHVRRREWRRAITFLTTVYHLGYNHPEQARLIADLHVRADNHAAAANWYQKAVDRGMDDTRIMMHAAQAKHDAGQPEAARKAALIATESEDREVATQARLLLGLIERDRGNLERAVEHWRQAADRGQAPVQIHIQLANHAFNEGEYGEAAKHFQVALDRSHCAKSMYQGLFASRLQLEERTAAKDALRQYVERFGFDREAQLLVSQLVESKE